MKGVFLLAVVGFLAYEFLSAKKQAGVLPPGTAKNPIQGPGGLADANAEAARSICRASGGTVAACEAVAKLNYLNARQYEIAGGALKDAGGYVYSGVRSAGSYFA